MAGALIVGGTGGLGSAVVRRFAKEGMNIDFTYLKAVESAQRLIEEAQSFGVTARAHALDLRDTDHIREVVRDSAQADSLMAVIFAAGTGVNRPLLQIKPKHWNWVFDVNARSFLIVLQEAVEPLSSVNGSLTALTSVGSRRALWPDYSVVGASKAALESLVRYAAIETASLGVRVNAVSPGLVETKALEAFPNKPWMMESYRKQSPMGRLVTPEQVANCVWWLSGPECSMITGQTLVIDGGWEVVGLSD